MRCTPTTLTNLAGAYLDSGRLPEALPPFEQAARGIAKRLSQHEHNQRIIAVTIRVYGKTQQPDKAETWRLKWQVEKAKRGQSGTAICCNGSVP